MSKKDTSKNTGKQYKYAKTGSYKKRRFWHGSCYSSLQTRKRKRIKKKQQTRIETRRRTQ